MWVQLLSLVAVIYAIRRAFLFKRAARSVGNIPGYRVLVNTNSLGGFLLPKVHGVNQGRNFAFRDKHSVYAWAGCDIITHVSVFPNKADVFVADAAVAREIANDRSLFPKPVEAYDSLAIFGYNIVASEGEDWKKHRKICAPSFSERNNRLVRDETIFTVNDIFENAWGGNEKIVVDHFLDITIPITRAVISAAGFGFRNTWKDDKKPPPTGHWMTFKESLDTVVRNTIPRLMIPDWVIPLAEKTRHIDRAFRDLRSYLLELIEARKYSEKASANDLFSCLLEANAGEGEGESLSADELIGNIFIFLFAGHETTAHTLCYAIALLALHQDEQEKLYQQIQSVVKDPSAPAYDEIPLLTRPLAVFNETLRMFPPVSLIVKRSTKDTTLTTNNTQGERVVVPVPKDTYITIDVPALHYNPKYWEDPLTFKPERFMQSNWKKDAFVAFSIGARACLGRRFAEIESVIVLTMIVARYKITVKEEPQYAHETFEQRKERVLKSTNFLTLTPLKVPLVFTRR